MKVIKFLAAAAMTIGVETHGYANTEISNCSGYDPKGQIWVYGTCNGTFFSAWAGGSYITGTCQEKGMFNAYNPKTQSFIYGNCY